MRRCGLLPPPRSTSNPMSELDRRLSILEAQIGSVRSPTRRERLVAMQVYMLTGSPAARWLAMRDRSKQ